MAQFFKRRAKPSPNKNEAKVQRSRAAASLVSGAGLVGQRFPMVERLSVDLVFTNPQGHPMDHKTLTFHPDDACDFAVPCPGVCGRGSYDLAGKIQGVIEAHESFSESNGTCQETLYAGLPEVCGHRLKCRIDVKYSPDSQPVDPAGG